MDPGKGPDGEADPERHDQQEQQQPFVPEAGHGNGIGRRIAHDRADQGGDGGDPDRLPQEAVIIGIAQEFVPIGQRQDGLLDAGGHEGVEGEHHHDGDRHHQQQDQQRQDRRQQQPGPAVRLGSHGDRPAGPLTKRLPRS